jgi:hypothetical protein
MRMFEYLLLLDQALLVFDVRGFEFLDAGCTTIPNFFRGEARAITRKSTVVRMTNGSIVSTSGNRRHALSHFS